jgi:S1-C subfamily serine protease
MISPLSTHPTFAILLSADARNLKMFILKILLTFVTFAVVVTDAIAQVNTTAQINTSVERAVPEDNLAYPVLLIIKNGKGSGFFLNTATVQYLVTANHVIAEDPSLFDPATKMYKPDAELQAISYSADPADTATRNVLKVNLHEVQTMGHLKVDPAADVAVMAIGSYQKMPINTTQLQFSTALPGATWSEVAAHGTVGVSIEAVKTLDQVLVGNDVIMYGYPTSLGLTPTPQLDPDRPLLRKGIVAGKNPLRHSIVLDCPAYLGDSGGPVFEIDRTFVQRTFRLIGVVEQYVPFTQTDARTFIMQTNSGYSIVTPMDAVLALIR